MDPETEYWLQSSGLMVIVAVAALCGIHHLMKVAGIRTRQDLTDVEKIVQVILMLMTGALAWGAGLLGTMGSLVMVMFCDNAPAAACLSLALVVLLVGGFVAALAMFAFKACFEKMIEPSGTSIFIQSRYLRSPTSCIVMMPDVDFVWFGVMSMSLLAMIYALAIRKPRLPIAAARPHSVPGDEQR
ncbi:MAG: hypothetical protein JWP89_3599 [Schlesneria sp.]|nr:hypothetical protein [Schlesneria sp.]